MGSHSNRGKIFEGDIRRSLKRFNEGERIWWRRIPDFRTWYHLNKNLYKPKVPGDFEAIHRGTYYLFELKCFDEETEILTLGGFKPIKDITYENQIATLNNENKHLEYENPIEIFSYDYKGKMLHFNGNFIDQLVTPNHNLWIKKFSKGKYQFGRAENFNSNWKFLGGARWRGGNVNTVKIPTVDGPGNVINNEFKINDFLRLFGAYLAEGNIDIQSSSFRIVISNHDLRWKYELAEILEKYDFSPYIDERRLVFSSKQLAKYLKKFGKSKKKFIPRWIKNLSPKKLKILYEEMYRGDGHKSPPRYRSYSTSSKKLADDVQEILLKMNIHASNRSFISLSGNPNYKISMYKKNHFGTLNSPDKIPYDGKIYCVEVPNHIIYVRRNGYGMWSGNSTKGDYFHFNWFKKHQRENLKQVEMNGGRGYLLFSKRERPVLGRAISIWEYLELEDSFAEQGRKSVDTSAMLEAGVELPRTPSSFDLTPLFEHVEKKKEENKKKLEDFIN